MFSVYWVLTVGGIVTSSSASCASVRAWTLSGCWAWDLSALPSGPFNLSSGRSLSSGDGAPGCRYKPGVDFVGGTIRTIHSGMTRDSCCQQCWATEGCGAAVYGVADAGCWLKSAAVANHTRSKAGVIGCWTDPNAPPAPPAPLPPPPPPSPPSPPGPSPPARGPEYVVSSPCTDVPPAVIDAACPNAVLPLVPAPGYALQGCLNLGVLSRQSVAAIDGNASSGIRIVYSGGNDTVGCKYPRSLVYEIVCDRSAPVNAGPDPTMTSKQCEYTVTWRTPIGCPRPDPDPLGCPIELPRPTPPQLAYQQSELVATVGFQMDTYAYDDGDPGCNAKNWRAGPNTSQPATLAPTHLNTTQWAKVLSDFGARRAWADAKHGCGFLLWPTNTTLPNGSPYGYDVGSAGALGRDVVAEFRYACEAAGIAPGWYYSLKVMRSFPIAVAMHSHACNCRQKLTP